MHRLTIFTPTYNRSKTLPKLYESLCSQSDNSFVWLVIDDGSTDNTFELISSWQKEAPFCIEFYYQKNSGKMAAYNKALEMTKTDLFLCLDSDDYLVLDAVSIIYRVADEQFFNSGMISGIVAFKGRDENTPIGNYFPSGIQYSELRGLYKLGFKGDTTLIFKTAIAKNTPFPIIKGEKFVSEMFVYNQIDDFYKMKLVPRVLTVCEYQEDGYTRNPYALVKKNPMGWALIYFQKAQYEPRVFARFIDIAFAESYVLMASKDAFISAKEQLFYNRRMVNYVAMPLAFLIFIRRMMVHNNG